MTTENKKDGFSVWWEQNEAKLAVRWNNRDALRHLAYMAWTSGEIVGIKSTVETMRRLSSQPSPRLPGE